MFSLTNLNRLIIGLIGLVAGIGFWAAAPAKPTVAAGDVTHYSSTWTATNYLVANRSLPPSNSTYTDQIVLGVATWKVIGFFDNNGPQYKETWDSSSTDLPSFNRSNQTMTGGNASHWIAGAIWESNDTGKLHNISISRVPVGTALNIYSGNAAKVGGMTASCQIGQDSECFYATGSYGFTDYDSFNTVQSGKDLTVGVAMPAYWTVSGTVCEVPDPACQ